MPSSRILPAVLAVLLAGSAQQPAAASYRDLIFGAREAFGAGDNAAALAALSEALTMEAGDPAAFLLIGEVYIRLGRCGEAAAALARGLEMVPEGSPMAIAILLKMSIALHRDKQLVKAQEGFRRVLEADPEQKGSHLLLGGMLLDEGRLDEAIQEFRSEIALHVSTGAGASKPEPGSLLDQALSGLGIATYRAGDHALAMQILAKTRTVEGHYHLALALMKEERWEEAAAKLEGVLRVAPDHRGAIQSLARCASAMGQVDRQKQILEQLQSHYRKDRERDEARWQAGPILASAQRMMEEGDAAGARSALGEIQNAERLDDKMLLDLARLWLEAGSPEESERSYEAVRSRKPLSPEPVFQLGRIRLQRDDRAGALTLFKRAVVLSPLDVRYRRELARLYSGMGAAAEALAELKVAAKIHPDDADLHLDLGRALAEAGAHEEAAEALEAAIRLGRDDDEVHESLLELYRRMGDEEHSEEQMRILESRGVSGAKRP